MFWNSLVVDGFSLLFVFPLLSYMSHAPEQLDNMGRQQARRHGRLRPNRPTDDRVRRRESQPGHSKDMSMYFPQLPSSRLRRQARSYSCRSSIALFMSIKHESRMVADAFNEKTHAHPLASTFSSHVANSISSFPCRFTPLPSHSPEVRLSVCLSVCTHI